MVTTSSNLTKLRKKLIPPPDGQDVAKLRTAVVSAYDTADGTVDITLNGATIPNVPVLSRAAFAVGTTVQVLSYRGSLLVIGASGNGAQPVEATGSTSNGTTTSTSYTNSLTTTGTHGVAFIAPPSGKIQILGRASAGSSTVGQYAQLDYEVRTGSTIGSGTLVRTTNNNTASVFLSSTSGGQGPLNISGLLTGLTPGAVYNACLTYASSSGSSTASFNRRQIAVYPL
jgi:hypothetical protein